MNDIANPPYAPTALDEPDRSILDPGIAALLDFEPAPRQVPRPDGWTPARQRRFIVQLALTGSPKAAADLMGKNLSGLKHLYRTDGADSFRAAWKAAIELAASRKRNHRASALPASSEVPGTASRSPRGQHKHKPGQSCGECGQVVEEMTEERQEYLDTMRSIRNRLLSCRRFYLASVAECPRKRLAWELLVGPTDWERAKRMEPQDDEPIPDPERNSYGLPSMRKPDMVLTVGSGLLPELTGGEDALAELRQSFSESAESKTNDSAADASAWSRDACPDRPTTGNAVSIDVTDSLRDGIGHDRLERLRAEFSGERQLPQDDETDAMLRAIAAAREAHPEDFD